MKMKLKKDGRTVSVLPREKYSTYSGEYSEILVPYTKQELQNKKISNESVSHVLLVNRKNLTEIKEFAG